MIRPPDAEIANAIAQENPWWDEQSLLSPRFSKAQPRHFLDNFQKLVIKEKPRREVVLLGARRVGKTFLIHHSIQKLIAQGVPAKQILYLQIDNPLYVGLSLDKMLDHFQRATGSDWRSQKCYIYFDEIQYLKDWEVHLKSLHDSGSSTRFIVSGSAGAALQHGSKESGAGRFTNFHLPPLIFAEYLAFRDLENLIESDSEGYYTTDIDLLNEEFLRYLNFGGYPEIAILSEAAENTTRYMRSDIIDKVLLRDLPSLYGISDVRELYRLFTMLAFNSGHELSLDALSKDSAVTKITLKRYIEYLETAFLVRSLSRVDQSAKHFQRERTNKIYLTNPSLRTGMFSPITMSSAHLGYAVETGIFAQRLHDPSANLHYARWKLSQKDCELDFVELDPALRVFKAVEIKFTDRVVKQPGTWAPWLAFCRKNGLRELTITTRTHAGKTERNGTDIIFEPSALHAYRAGKMTLSSEADE